MLGGSWFSKVPKENKNAGEDTGANDVEGTNSRTKSLPQQSTKPKTMRNNESNKAAWNGVNREIRGVDR